VNIFEAAHALFVEHFGEPFLRRPRAIAALYVASARGPDFKPGDE
jgi:hypothetical protein